MGYKTGGLWPGAAERSIVIRARGDGYWTLLVHYHAVDGVAPESDRFEQLTSEEAVDVVDAILLSSAELDQRRGL